MNVNSWQIDRCLLRTPRENRGTLIEPPFDSTPDMVVDNLCCRTHQQYDMHGRTLAEIAQLARCEMLAAARRWTASYRHVPDEPPDPHGMIYMAGHQPRMLHPGVWFKNYVLGELAALHSAAAVNLIVDSDVAADPFVPIPGGSPAEPVVKNVPFDSCDPQKKIPDEERRIEDRDIFESFGSRAAEQISPLVADPMVRRYWPMVVEQSNHTDNLGACLAQARHRLEGELWQFDSLEVPQSHLCDGEAFQWFVAHILALLPEFHAIYNEALRKYRDYHRLRSRLHPAPDLAEDGEWLEIPFWIWTDDDHSRRRAFARAAAGEIIVTDRQTLKIALPLRAGGDAALAVERLLDLHQGGVRIRPRALLTTLWTRLALCDLFIHGVGGAKYDEVTDRIIERFFGLHSPRFLVASATLFLPVEIASADIREQKSISRELRELTYHPERYIDGSSNSPTEQISLKRQWIATPPTPENARRRCQAIRAANAAMQAWVEPRRQELLACQTEAAHRLDAAKILSRRDYASCLYPEALLRDFFAAALPKA